MPVLSPCPELEVLRRFALGQISVEETESISGHVADCPLCIQALETFSDRDSLTDALASAVELPLPTAVRELIERLKKAVPTAPPSTAETSLADTANGKAAGKAANAGAGGMDFLAPPEQADELGRLGGYRILRVLGQGGMGLVFEADDPQLKRRTALKVMKPAFAENPSARQRFQREAEALAAVRNEHVVTVFRVGAENNVPFLAMEYLEGQSLEHVLKAGGAMEVSIVIRLGLQIARGLAAAHDRGLIHRDIKPSNIWLEPAQEGAPATSGRVKLLDFGLARHDADDEEHITLSGVVVGTPNYMSPEQAQGFPIDRRTDLFSLGCVLYRMITGQPAFQARNATGTLMAVVLETPPPPRQINPAIPPELNDLIVRLLAKKPAQRPDSALSVIDALQAIAKRVAFGSDLPTVALVREDSGSRPWRNRLRRAVLASALLMLIGGGLLLSQIILRLRDKEGNVLLEMKLARDIKVEIEPVGDKEERSAGGQKPPADSSDRRSADERRNPPTGSAWQGWPADAPPPAIAPFDAEQAKRHQEAWATYLKVPVEREIELPGGVTLAMMLIPPGEFLMGAPDAELERFLKDAKAANNIKAIEQIPWGSPQHLVRITQPFYLGKYEVTQEQWEAVMGNNPSVFAKSGVKPEYATKVAGMDTGKHPVECTTWITATQFCAQVNQIHSLQPFYPHAADSATSQIKTIYRLPTEAEWEYACRAGTTTTYWSGDNEADVLRTDWIDKNSDGRTHAVGELPANPFGLFDMHGNAREFCQDLWDSAYYQSSPTNNPTGPSTGVAVVRRGGSWYSADWETRSASRLPMRAKNVYSASSGFRLAAVPSTEPIPPSVASEPSVGNADRAAAEWVLSLGGRVTVESAGQSRDLTDIGQLSSDSFHVIAVDLYNDGKANSSAVMDGDLERLAPLGRLTFLNLRDTTITRRGVARLSTFSSLSTLHLRGTRVGNAGLQRLQGLNTLTDLYFSGTGVTDEGLQHLQALPNLRRLNFGGLNITDAGFVHLGRMTSLIDINANNTLVTDAGLKHLAGLNLTNLQLHGRRPKITDAGVDQISQFTNLSCLSLANKPITDLSVPQLSQLRHLDYLYISDTRISRAGYESLRKALPKATINWSERNDTAARGVLQAGGRVTISQQGENTTIALIDQLPLELFAVTEVDLAGIKNLPDDLWPKLAALETLQSLDLTGSNVGDAAMSQLGPLASVRELSLARTAVTDAGLAPLKAWAALTTLNLDGTAVTGSGLANVEGLAHLREVRLGSSAPSEDGLIVLGRLGRLERLSLKDSQFSNAGLKRLTTLRNLKELDLSGTTVTSADVATLQKALPDCTLIWPARP